METSVPSKFMSDIEYSDITSDDIKSFDCRRVAKLLFFSHGSWKMTYFIFSLP